MTSTKTTYHRDGTLTYWSVTDQRWHRHVRSVSDAALDSMMPEERERVRRHFGAPTTKYRVKQDEGDGRFWRIWWTDDERTWRPVDAGVRYSSRHAAQVELRKLQQADEAMVRDTH
ncbi:MAG: hypothetical protein ABFE01_11870 [Phycisphaerales bacterium]